MLYSLLSTPHLRCGLLCYFPSQFRSCPTGGELFNHLRCAQRFTPDVTRFYLQLLFLHWNIYILSILFIAISNLKSPAGLPWLSSTHRFWLRQNNWWLYLDITWHPGLLDGGLSSCRTISCIVNILNGMRCESVRWWSFMIMPMMHICNDFRLGPLLCCPRLPAQADVPEHCSNLM